MSDRDTSTDDRRTRKRDRPKRSLTKSLARIVLLLAVFLVIVKVGGCADRLFFYPIRGDYAAHPQAAFERTAKRTHRPQPTNESRRVASSEQ